MVGPCEIVTKMITFTLPAPPNRANDSRNHWKVYKDKKAYYKECGWMIKSQIALNALHGKIEATNHLVIKDGAGYYRFTPFEYVEIEISVDVQKYYDWDNLANLCKWPQDTLVSNGIIKSDDWAHCRPRGLPTQVLKPKKTDVRELRITLYPRGPFTSL